MSRQVAALLVVLAAPVFAASDPQDQAGSKDPALFNRMKGFHIYRYEEKQFDTYDFPVASGKTQAVEGHSVYVDYYANEGVTNPSSIQVVRNYTNAAKAIGGTVVYEFEDGGLQYATIKVVKNDVETWVFVDGGANGSYKLNVIEKEAMAQEIVANAAALASGIREAGKIAVYGIFFDTDKADLGAHARRDREAAQSRREAEAVRRRAHRQPGHVRPQPQALAGAGGGGGRGAHEEGRRCGAADAVRRGTDVAGGGERERRGAREEPPRGARRPVARTPSGARVVATRLDLSPLPKLPDASGPGHDGPLPKDRLDGPPPSARRAR